MLVDFLKEELRSLNSLLIKIADETAVPGVMHRNTFINSTKLLDKTYN